MKIQNLCLLTSNLYAGSVFHCSMRIWFPGCWGMLLTGREDAAKALWEAADSAFFNVQDSLRSGRQEFAAE